MRLEGKKVSGSGVGRPGQGEVKRMIGVREGGEE